MIDFKELKNKRGSGVEKLRAAAEGSKDQYTDNRFWSPTVDKTGNGFAVIRFLPDKESLNWVTYYEHGFQGPTGKWYIEKSRTSLKNQPDPVSEMNTRLWNSGREEDKQTARDRKRKVNNVSNIYVVSDPANPENEGKVFLYRYGVKIKEKVLAAANPQYQDETPFDPFDLWEGANFKIKIANVAGYRNYDKSAFEDPSPLSEDESLLESVYNQTHGLGEFVDPANYKTYNQLKERLAEVLGEVDHQQNEVAVENGDDDDDVPYTTNDEQNETHSMDAEPVAAGVEADDDQKALDYFAKMTQKD